MHSEGTVLSPSTTRTTAFFMFALAVPKEFFTSMGMAVIFLIIGKTYSSTLASSQSTTPRVWVVMLVTLHEAAVGIGKLVAHLDAAGRARPACPLR